MESTSLLENKNSEPQHTPNYKGMIIRATVIVLGILLVLCLNNFYQGNFNPLGQNQCYNDLVHNWTGGLNTYFRNNLSGRNAILIFTALLVDLAMLTTFYFWIFKWTDWVILYAIMLFYGVRGMLILNLFQLTFPDGYNFYYPGFPSIAVCYLATNDFFYSGHIGFPIIFALEYWRKGEKYLVIPCVTISILEGAMMLITRGHYSIDLIFGVIFAHYFHKIAILIDPIMDKYICCACKNCTSNSDRVEKVESNK
jgi:hypothetical protein